MMMVQKLHTPESCEEIKEVKVQYVILSLHTISISIGATSNSAPDTGAEMPSCFGIESDNRGS